MVMPVTWPASNTVTPVAVTPPAGAGEKVTVGGLVYPEPVVLTSALSTVVRLTLTPSIALNVFNPSRVLPLRV